MAEQIITRIVPDLAAARQASAKQQRASEQAARRRRDDTKEAAKDKPATMPKRRAKRTASDLPRRGRLAPGVAAKGSALGAMAKANIMAVIAKAGLEVSTAVVFPIAETFAKELGPVGEVLALKIENMRRTIEDYKAYFSAALSAIQETRSSVDGSALMGAQINRADITGIYGARRKVAYLREASAAVVQDKLGQGAVRKLAAELAENLKQGTAPIRK
jgi:hypothetical protein